jgi:hypothetical protein
MATSYLAENKASTIILVIVCVLFLCCVSCIISFMTGLFTSRRTRPDTTICPTPSPTTCPTPNPTTCPTPGPTMCPTPPPTVCPTPSPAPTGLFYLNPEMNNGGWNRSESQAACSPYNATIASKGNLMQGFNKGYELCQFGYLSDDAPSLVLQQDRQGCGQRGYNTNHVGPETKSGVYCIGPLTPGNRQLNSIAL